MPVGRVDPRLERGLGQQVDLPLGEPGEAAAQGPDHPVLALLGEDAEVGQVLGEPEGLDVALGEGAFVRLGVGEAEQVPELPGGFEGDPGLLGDLGLGEAGALTQQALLEGVDHTRAGRRRVVLVGRRFGCAHVRCSAVS